MKYYVIINGESSLDIEGLAIESLPAISKPLMRSKREEIDGRNGDIITQLGFSAYDKTLKIGLWGNYDIDEIISYFNQDGIITFSNEPDMYYNFTILNRIDFINQLEAFRKATITIHCQPFKYKEEETQTLELEEHQEEGTSFNLEDTIEAPMNIDLKGNTSQVQLSGKNLFDEDTIIPNSIPTGTTGAFSYSNGILTITNPNNDVFLPGLYSNRDKINGINISVKANTNYTLSFTTDRNDTKTAIYVLNDNNKYVNLSSFTTNNVITFNTSTYTEIAVRFGSTASIGTITHISNIQLEESNQATPYEQYCGGTPSPNPSYPQDIHNVSGNNDIVVCGKNLFIPTLTNNGTDIQHSNCNVSLTNDEFSLTSTGSNIRIGEVINKNNNYTNSAGVLYNVNGNSKVYVKCTNTDFNGIFITSYGSDKKSLGYTQLTSEEYTFPANAVYFSVRFGINGSTTGTTYKTKVMVSLTPITTYEAYNGTTYPINLPAGMELCKIGTYQDYIYKDNDKWYLHKETGKIVYNGAEENWVRNRANTSSPWFFYRVKQTGQVAGNVFYTNHFKFSANYAGLDNSCYCGNTNIIFGCVKVNGSYLETLDDWKNWLASNNTIVYYPISTPINTEITDTTLIEQLEAIYNAKSKNGTTNINQVNNDEMFILGVDYFTGTNSITITNHGNYYSKPKLTLTGTGNIGIYLNDNQIFQVALGTNETIIIDTDKMEAYYESTLKNRQVIGDYNSFKLLSGENTIRISGTFSKLQVDNYSRWI